MKRYILLIVLFLALITLTAGCDSTPSQNIKSSEKPVLTLDMIKEKYKTENLGEIIKTYDYGTYMLVEYLNGAHQQRFDLYNLKTGDRDKMPLDSEADVWNFVSGDRIEFKARGINQLNDRKSFPYYIVCTRVGEVIESENDFHYEKIELYKGINEGEEISGNRNGMLCDLKVTLTGLEMEFTHKSGNVEKLYIDDVATQAMKTSYDSANKQFLMELLGVSVSPELLKRQINGKNRYIDSIEIREKEENSLVIVNIKDAVNSYTVETDQDEFPWIRIKFKNSN